MKVFVLTLVIACFGLAASQGLIVGENPFKVGLPFNPVETAAKFLEMFREFKATFKKTYSSPQEEAKRLNIFTNNYKTITEFAKTPDLGFKLKLNELADLTLDEFNKLLNGLLIPPDELDLISKAKRSNDDFDINKDVDWRLKGAVLPVRNQGNCGSCYAFSTAAALEAYIFNRTGKLEYLSPQNIVDCSSGLPYANRGCVGGYLEGVFNYVKNNGIATEENYKYKEKYEYSCKLDVAKLPTKINGYRQIRSNDLEKAVSTNGPVVVGIDASQDSFRFYSDGIYYEPKCRPSKINHAVLLIGYGTERSGDKYWLIKNSYGTSWGKDGYVKISRNVRNHCGLGVYSIQPY